MVWIAKKAKKQKFWFGKKVHKYEIKDEGEEWGRCWAKTDDGIKNLNFPTSWSLCWPRSESFSLNRPDSSAVWFWPVPGCWPDSSPGSGCCGQGCGSGEGGWPAGRWRTGCCIRSEWRWDRAGRRFSSGTGPRSPGTTPTPRSSAFHSILPISSVCDFTPAPCYWHHRSSYSLTIRLTERAKILCLQTANTSNTKYGNITALPLYYCYDSCKKKQLINKQYYNNEYNYFLLL